MTGHAFQVLVGDEQLRESLASIRRAITLEGRFVFETRNPLARGWEEWVPANAVEIENGTSFVRMSHQVEEPVAGDMVSFTTTFSCPDWDEDQVSRSTLRFLDMGRLSELLDGAGLAIVEQFGDWDRQRLTDASSEIITVARRR